MEEAVDGCLQTPCAAALWIAGAFKEGLGFMLDEGNDLVVAQGLCILFIGSECGTAVAARSSSSKQQQHLRVELALWLAEEFKTGFIVSLALQPLKRLE